MRQLGSSLIAGGVALLLATFAWAQSIPGLPHVMVNASSFIAATWDPTKLAGGSTLSGGNLKWTGAAGSTGNVRTTKSSITKYYGEVTYGCSSCGAGNAFVGSIDFSAGVATQSACGSIPATYFIFRDDGLKCNNSSSASYGSALSNNQVVSIAIDNSLGSGSGKIWVGTCSAGTITWFNSGNPGTGANPMYSILTGNEGFVGGSMTAGTGFTWTINAGSSAYACNPASNNASGFGNL